MVRREPPTTEEGWYALHDLRTVDWDAWRDAPQRVRDRALAEVVDFLSGAEAVEDADAGDSALYAITGHEADLMILHLRPTMADIELLERRFDGTEFARFTEKAYSYVSVTEASGYSERAREYFEGEVDDDSGLAQYIRSRLHPEIPDAEHVSFYPMSKRRDPDRNWYDLPFEERAEHMESHGDIGRGYAGKVNQMITGSVGIDDWEWGVTLWADDLVDVKDLLYEMRFDPSSSKFAEFGPFYVGRRFPPADLGAYLAGDHVPTGDERAGAGSADAVTASAHAGDGADRHDDHSGASGGHSRGRGGHEHGNSDGEAADRASGAESDGEAGSGSDSSHDGGGPPRSVRESADSENVSVVDDAGQRLANFGVYSEDYDDGDHALLCYLDADAEAVVDDVEGLRGNFDHYDTHVLTSVRAEGGQAAIVSIWTTESAADTALGFLTDVDGVAESVRGALGDADAAHGGSDAGGAESETSDEGSVAAADIREELADSGVYAGRPHGEDVYALVLYSNADPAALEPEVEELSDGFDRYDTHVRTSVYDDPDAETAAVVSLWDTQSAADTAADFLTDLPGIVGRPKDRDGFGTMGMFYTVRPDYREEFVETFESVGEQLAAMDGHRETALLVNTDDENDMFIASRWDAKEDAMAFFRSEEFRDTVEWGREVLADRPRHVFLA